VNALLLLLEQLRITGMDESWRPGLLRNAVAGPIETAQRAGVRPASIATHAIARAAAGNASGSPGLTPLPGLEARRAPIQQLTLEEKTSEAIQAPITRKVTRLLRLAFAGRQQAVAQP
jgi:hypothetical protein